MRLSAAKKFAHNAKRKKHGRLLFANKKKRKPKKPARPLGKQLVPKSMPWNKPWTWMPNATLWLSTNKAFWIRTWAVPVHPRTLGFNITTEEEDACVGLLVG